MGKMQYFFADMKKRYDNIANEDIPDQMWENSNVPIKYNGEAL